MTVMQAIVWMAAGFLLGAWAGQHIGMALEHRRLADLMRDVLTELKNEGMDTTGVRWILEKYVYGRH